MAFSSLLAANDTKPPDLFSSTNSNFGDWQVALRCIYLRSLSSYTF